MLLYERLGILLDDYQADCVSAKYIANKRLSGRFVFVYAIQ
jgi:hypothetical protein